MRPTSSHRPVVFAVTLLLALGGCASGGGGGGDTARPEGSTSNRIVRAELEPLVELSAMQAIQRLRSRWLRNRPGLRTEPVLYVDGSRRGGLDELDSLRAADVEQIDYMNSSDASTRFGTGHSAGAILVTTAR